MCPCADSSAYSIGTWGMNVVRYRTIGPPGRGTLSDSCADAHASLEFAEIRSYVVVLVEHDVRQKLRRILDRRIATPDT